MRVNKMNVVIYSKPKCGFCNNAKALLNSKGIGYTEMVLGQDFTRDFLMETFPTAKSYPVIVIDGFNIGGFKELQTQLNEQVEDNRKLLNE